MIELLTQMKMKARPPRAPEGLSEAMELRLSAHDRSRVEWMVQVGLPRAGESKYEVEFRIEIPANLYSVHNAWDHLQLFTRLQSPSEEGDLHAAEHVDIDELRRDVLTVAQRLKGLRETFNRTCLSAHRLVALPLPSLAPSLCQLIGQAIAAVADMRGWLGTTDEDERILPPVLREWELAEEFLSHQLLDFFAAAQKALDAWVASRAAIEAEWVEEVRGRLAEALGEELEHRQRRGFLNPRADRPAELAEFVARGSHLKKHFQGVLFLDVHSYMVDSRLRNWTSIVAAALAAGFWLGFTLLPIHARARAGLGLGTIFAFALAYALKDRLKEVTRGWLAGHLVRLYGQRVSTLRLPARVDGQRGQRRLLVEARERFDCTAGEGEDALNRPAGLTRRLVFLHYRMQATAHAAGELERAGIRYFKHVFRYDLSAIFGRLDDAVKRVPVLDDTSRRLRFVDAAKEYRLPVRVTARTTTTASTGELQAELVLSKRGVERLELLNKPAG